MDTSIMLFTRDLRLHDNPALVEAVAAAPHVVPLFVYDDRLLARTRPNRVHFLAAAVSDLRERLRRIGSDLIVRRGHPAGEVAMIAARTGAGALFLADDRSHYAARRLAALRVLPLRVSVHPGVTVVPPGLLTPVSGDHYRVFTPYWRAWASAPRRPLAEAPISVTLPPGLRSEPLPDPYDLVKGVPSPHLMPGGETAGRHRMALFLNQQVDGYDAERDVLAHDGTSRLSAYLRFGCVSPLELATEAGSHDAFTRQLAWRDFHYQVAAAFPDLAWRDYRPRGITRHEDLAALHAWAGARTGYPIVDAAMRQLHEEGFMHNRARMITASFLTRTLKLHWRHGYEHFDHWLADGDVANNAGNWQWIAGTGNDTRPNRVMNPLRQAARFDPDGAYVRRYLPELADVPDACVHEPWLSPVRHEYPKPIIDPEELASAARS